MVKLIKNIVLGLLLLIVMSIIGTFVLKVFDVLLKLRYENIGVCGFKVGFVAWLGMLLMNIIILLRKRKSNTK